MGSPGAGRVLATAAIVIRGAQSVTTAASLLLNIKPKARELESHGFVMHSLQAAVAAVGRTFGERLGRGLDDVSVDVAGTDLRVVTGQPTLA